MEAVGQSDTVIGTVISTNPITIKIRADLILKASSGVLLFSRNVTDYEVPVQWNDADGVVNKTMLVKNALKTGETVLLIKKLGGQKYIVFDRVG